MKVSVLMGIYNCASTLDEAMESLYCQTFKDFKVILCDDGSADNTYEVAKHHADTHDNVVLVRNEKNMGLNHTLNHCLKYADTEYIARMDGDDISLPTRFEKEVGFLDTHPEYAIVSTPMIYFDEKGEFGRGKGGFAPTKKTFINGTPHCHAPCMVRREAFEAVGGYSVDKRLLRVEDYHLWMKMYAKGYRGYNLDECLYAMRDDRQATSRRKFKYRLNVSYAHYLACRTLHLPLKGYFYCLVPILKGLTPLPIYNYFHRKHLNN
jgi:glycosyltransferase EpsE